MECAHASKPNPPRSLHFAGTKSLQCLYSEGTSPGTGQPKNQLSNPLLASDPGPLPGNTFSLKSSCREEAKKGGPVNPEDNELLRGVNQDLS